MLVSNEMLCSINMAKQKGYNTIEDAVAAGLGIIERNERADKEEFIGIIYQDPKTKKYHYTEPKGQHRSAKSEGTFKIPKGSARAIFHNHPKLADRKKRDANRDHFSKGDMDLAKRTGLKSFIGVDNAIKMYDPSKKMSRRGEPVLAQIPVEQLPSKRRSLLPESLQSKLLNSERVQKSADAELIAADLERMK